MGNGTRQGRSRKLKRGVSSSRMLTYIWSLLKGVNVNLAGQLQESFTLLAIVSVVVQPLVSHASRSEKAWRMSGHNPSPFHAQHGKTQWPAERLLSCTRMGQEIRSWAKKPNPPRALIAPSWLTLPGGENVC